VVNYTEAEEVEGN